MAQRRPMAGRRLRGGAGGAGVLGHNPELATPPSVNSDSATNVGHNPVLAPADRRFTTYAPLEAARAPFPPRAATRGRARTRSRGPSSRAPSSARHRPRRAPAPTAGPDARLDHRHRIAEQREEGGCGDDATRRPVVAALPEDPQAAAKRVVFDELSRGVSGSRFHLDRPIYRPLSCKRERSGGSSRRGGDRSLNRVRGRRLVDAEHHLEHRHRRRQRAGAGALHDPPERRR